MAKVKAPETKALESKFIELKDKKEFPDGIHYFLLGVGSVAKNTSKNEFWDDSALGEDKETVQVPYSSFWATRMVDGQEKPIELKWITNYDENGEIVPNDPAVLLGLTNRDTNLHRKVYPKTSPKMKTIPNMPQTTIWVPVLHLKSPLTKKSNLSEMQEGRVVHLGLSVSVYQKVLEASKKVVDVLQSDNPNCLGRMFNITINRKATSPGDYYKVDATPSILQEKGLAEFTSLMVQERANIIEYVDTRTFQRVNGGETGAEGAENVWQFICEILDMSKSQVLANYFVGKRTNVESIPTESISFDKMTVDSVTESFEESDE